ncbi:chromatin modification-related protein EAF1 B-like isoform X2 [Durio zibethinus]|uniref:Chromatin modification-related protein EAF1 B-like isoform X2 n=1 Tax=Durio zibethinus TaxID=66656 RepID=A0A6P6B341_DURZI|nr:chromatin modification-related protein EAF1 B-like isoform X2 [Durio zibethinus]
MHGCKSGSALLVNAEVDFMGGVVDGGIGTGFKTSPHRAAIEKAQAELRQEYDVRQERRRELEFLEKGGNPLDFKFGNAASVSFQSTSLTDQLAENFVTSEAKGSFALTASPHGDSVESSGRPGVPAVCEPHSADNLLLFDGENELPEGERKSMHLRRRNNVVPSEQSSQMDGTQNAKESEDSAIFRPYARRNRSKINRDGARSSSTDMVQGRGGHGSSLSARGASKDVKGLTSETNNQMDKNMPSVNATKSATSNGYLASKVITSDNRLNMELDGVQAVEETTDQSKDDLCESKVDVTVSQSFIDDLPNDPAQVEAHKTPVNLASEESDLVGGKEQVISTGLECPPGTAATKAENETSSNQLNGFGDAKIDRKSIPNEGQNSTAATRTKRLDSESSCTQNSLSLDVNNDNDNDVCINPKNVDSNGKPMTEPSENEESLNLAVGEMTKEKNEIKAVDNAAVIRDSNTSVNQNHSLNDSTVKVEEEIRSELQNEVSCPSNNEAQPSNHTISEADRKVITVPVDNSNSNKENFSASRPQGTMYNTICEIPETILSGRTSTANGDTQTSMDNHVKVVDEAHEDSILEEARVIEAKRKRIAELSVGTLPLENCRRSHWDFVLEEMAWLANDFAQERLWKMTAAAQICRRVAFTSRLKFDEQNQYWKLKKVALTLANAVMDFWLSAEVLLNSKDASLGPKNCGHDLVGSRANEVSENKTAELDMDANKEEKQHTGKNNELAIWAYALRYLKYNSSPVPSLLAEAPATPDRISDLGIMDISWDEYLTEESLFYAVPSGAMETYRRSIESYLIQTEKTGSSVQEEVETSAYDAGAEFGYEDFVNDEDEGETSTYYLPGAFEGSKLSKLNQKKRKISMRAHPARPYEMGVDLPYGNCAQQAMLIGKRPVNSLNGGPIPTKRVRTGSRQRVLSPFSSAAAAGGLQAPTKTDASSGDTNSFQDDQSTLHGGFQTQKSMEVESIGDFERQLLYDCAETPTKPKKKQKVSAYDQGWQLESTVHNVQRDYSKKRPESHHFDSNGTNGLYGQHNAKKLKIMKQQPDNAFDSTPSGSIPSPVGSQMSNMSYPSKIIRLFHGRERGRKAKTPKMSAAQPGSGSPWSLFEDQALVVLVHDLGPNWELVSDAINSTLQFKCIFHKPKECKERHKSLMDRSGDGADSADDSGSSQSYPSTLPGIPKGSARQLFQRLQGPMEEDTLKSHFEKIILIGKKQHHRWSQHDNQDPKQIVPVHNSHVIALSQVCPNNLNEGVLTPLDLCDATASSQDVLPLGYQASHAGGLAISNQGAVGSMLPASGGNSSLLGSSGMVLGSNLSSPSAPLNTSVRDGRYGVPITSLPADEQHRTPQYNQMLSGRNIQQSNLSLPGAVSGSDRGVPMLPGANGMGMMCGINRSMPMSRPGFQGMASSAMLNSGSVLSSNMVGIPSPVNMHSGPGSGQGNSMLRPHDAMHMMRPAQYLVHQRQLMVPELRMQAQGNSQGIPAFNGLSSAYPNQSTAPPVQLYPGHPQQQQQQSHALSNSHHAHLQGSNHSTGSQQQAYAMRVTKERQMQQHQLLMHQQQQQPKQKQQFATSSTLMPHIQPQTQLPISSSLQNSSQIQSQASPQPVSLPPLTPSSPMTPMSLQHQQKHHLAPHGLGRNPQPGASGLNNQIGKQRQRQPQPPQQQQQFQQSGRHHPHNRQQTQSQQQAKLLKGVGRGNMPVHQNLSVELAHLNGLSMAPGNQADEKGEQMVHLIQGQGLYSGSGMSPVQPSKPLISSQSSNHSQPQQKLFSGTASHSSKQLQQMASHSDNSSQGQVSTVPSGHTLSTVHQTVLPAAICSNHQHLQLQSQPHQKQVNQNQPTVQRMLQQNQQVNSDPPSKSQAEPAQGDRQPMNNASQMGTTTTMAMPQAGIDSVNDTVPIVAPVGSQRKSSEPVYNPGMSNVAAQVGSIGSPLKKSAGSDPIPSVSQGLGQRQLSGGLPPHGNNTGAQWPQQPQIQPSPTLPPSQQHYQPQEHLQQDQHNSPPQQLPLQQQSQQQTLHLQAVQGSLYHRPSNSKLE